MPGFSLTMDYTTKLCELTILKVMSLSYSGKWGFVIEENRTVCLASGYCNSNVMQHYAVLQQDCARYHRFSHSCLNMFWAWLFSEIKSFGNQFGF